MGVLRADGRELSLPGGFDRVLVDAPCTGLGALRRRPEARWRRTPADVPTLAQMGAMWLAAMEKGMLELREQAGAEVDELMSGRVEPRLPQARNADAFLAGLPPIEYVG